MSRKLSIFHYYQHYFLKSIVWAVLGYFAFFAVIIVAGGAMFSVNTPEGQTSFAGHEAAAAVFLMIGAWSSFREEILFFNQHGVSRKSAFFGFVASFLAISALFAVAVVFLPLMFAAVTSLLPHGDNIDVSSGLLFSLYADYLSTFSRGGAYLIEMLFNWLMFLAFGMGAYALSSLSYRFGKVGKTLIWAVPVASFILLPVLDVNVFDGAIVSLFIRMWQWFLGGNIAYATMTNGMITFAVASVLLSVGAFFSVRRVRLLR